MVLLHVRERLAHHALQLVGRRRPAERHAVTDRRVVVVAVGVLAHPPHHRRHRRPDRDLLVLDELQRLARARTGRRGSPASARRACPTTRLEWQPDTWNSGEVSSAAVCAAARPSGAPSSGARPSPTGDRVEDRVLEVGDHVAVRRDRALGPAGRAARVEDDGVVVLVDRHVGERRASVRPVSSSKRCSRGSSAEVGRVGVDQEHGLEVGQLVELRRRCARTGRGRPRAPWRPESCRP